jgi:hypothetical protein
MESITMTFDAMQQNRVRSACAEAGRILLAGTRVWTKGTTVSSAVVSGARVVPAAPGAPAFYAGIGFGAPTTAQHTNRMDVAHLRTGEPPV